MKGSAPQFADTSENDPTSVGNSDPTFITGSSRCAFLWGRAHVPKREANGRESYPSRRPWARSLNVAKRVIPGHVSIGLALSHSRGR